MLLDFLNGAVKNYFKVNFSVKLYNNLAVVKVENAV